MKKSLLESSLFHDEMVTMDGYDDCIIGVCEGFGKERVIAYDYNKVIKKLMKQGMDMEEAVEWYDFNMIGSYVGELTPVFIIKI